MSSLAQLKKDLRNHGTPERAVNSGWFFKTGPGQYGEGDVFIGVTVPEQRKIAAQYKDLSLADLSKLIDSKFHEERLTALIILTNQFKKGSEIERKEIYEFYLAHMQHINNWDLVDTSAGYIVGGWLADKDRDVLIKLAHSEVVWERRIAMMATFKYIMEGDPSDALFIAEILVHDEHDLIQKAVGWMLREVGKRCSVTDEEAFLDKYAATMPRTMLRYAIEKFPTERKRYYMNLKNS